MVNSKRSMDEAIVAGQSKKYRDYWMNKLSGDWKKSTFDCDFSNREHQPKNNSLNKKFEKVEFELTGDLYSKLIWIANDSDARLHMIFTTILTILLYKYDFEGYEDIIIGSPIYKQKDDGDFINTVLVLRNQVRKDMNFKKILYQVRQTIEEAVANQNYPMDVLLYELDIPFNSDRDDFPLFDIAVLLNNIHERKYIQHIRLNIIFSFLRADENIKLIVEYNSYMYREDTVRRIICNFEQLLKEGLGHADRSISKLEILSNSERKQILYEFNNTKGSILGENEFHGLYENQVQKTPTRISVVFEDKVLTYSELNKGANRMARFFRDRGVEVDRLVGILLDRSLLMVECILATWKAGGAYIPIDVQFPDQRIIQILADSSAVMLFTQSPYVAESVEVAYGGIIVKLDHENIIGNSANLDLMLDINRLAYVIYTSGSTGKPKGVMIEHIGMLNHMQAKIKELQITDMSILSQNASHTFDISVWQFFSALTVGGETVIYSDSLILEPEQFITQLLKDRITILEVVPSYLAVLLEFLDLKCVQFESLEYLLVTGEEVKRVLIERWFQKYPAIKVVNAYGPTEASDDITHFVMDIVPASMHIPIGKPLQNLNIYIVDKDMNLCPVGVKGEIYVSGIGVGRGYLKDEEKTRQVFMEDPYKEDGRLYKTGDLGCWREDGNIDFYGRIDHQVKIRGYRIELGEIENALLKFPAVKEAVVIDRLDEKGNKYLCAYLVGTSALDIRGIKVYLKEQLPDYLIPSYFWELQQIPLTPNGKIDRKALPALHLREKSSITFISKDNLDDIIKQTRNYKDIKEPYILPEEKREYFFNAISSALESEQSALQMLSKQRGETLFPLSHPQKMIYHSEKRYPNTAVENLIYIIKYNEELDRELLQNAINIVLKNNVALRLRPFEIEGDSSLETGQYIGAYRAYCLDYVDFSSEDIRLSMEQWLDRHNKTPFNFIGNDLYYFAYLKFNEAETGYYLKTHHIVSDGWSTFLLAGEIDRIYRKLERGEIEDSESNQAYIQYIADEREYLKSVQAREDMKFWHRYLLPLPQEVSFSSGHGSSLNIEGGALTLPLPSHVRSRLHQYRCEQKTSLFKLILASLSIYISRVTTLNDFVIGTLNHNRSLEIYRTIVGTFISFIPIRINVDEEKNFSHFVKIIGEELNYIIKNHQRYPFDILINELRENTGKDPTYFYNINLIGHPDIKDTNFKIEHHFPGFEPSQLSIHINFSNKDIDGVLELEWDYQHEIFSTSDIQDMHQGLINVLSDALNSPTKEISRLEILSAEQKQSILDQFCGRDVVYPENMNRIAGFEIYRSYILNSAGVMQPLGIPGELYVGVDTASRDISHSHGLSEEELIPDPFIKDGLMYKTGEWARWLPDGSMEFLGKIERLAFIEGNWINIGVIEDSLLRHEEIKKAVVVERSQKGDRILCAFLVAGRILYEAELVEWLGDELTDDLEHLYFFQLDKLPVTVGGDIDRGILEELDIDMNCNKDLVKPRNETELKLRTVWAAILGIEKEAIGIDSNFFELGGHSLKATLLIARIHKEFNVKVPMAQIFKTPSIKGLTLIINSLKVNTHLTIKPVEKRQYYTLSSAQKRLYFLQKLNPDGINYNMPEILTLDANIEKEKLENIFKKLIKRHEGLRTSFELKDGEPIQKVNEDVGFTIEYNQVLNKNQGKELDMIIKKITGNFVRPFDLSMAPLLRVGLIEVIGKRSILLLDMHHIITDGTSQEVLTQDFMTIHSEKELKPLKLQYKDFSEWQKNRKRDESLKKQQAYWLNLFSDELPVLMLPTDFQRPPMQSVLGASVGFEIDEKQTQNLKKIAKEADATLYMTILAVFNILLSKLSGQDDIIIGAPLAARYHTDFEGIIGMFINMLPIRNYPKVEKTFREFLGELKGQTIKAYENQEYQFEDLVDQILLKRDASRNPIFDIVLNLLNHSDYKGDVSSLGEKGGYTHRKGTSQFDLNLSAIDADEKIYFDLEYCTQLFKPDTIERFILYFKNIISSLSRTIDQKLLELEVISERELKKFFDIPISWRQQDVASIKLPASYHQERLWFIDKFESGYLYESSPTYHNIPFILRVQGSLDISALEQSIRLLIKRHEALRTRIITIDDKPVQQVDRTVKFNLSLLNLDVEGHLITFDEALSAALTEVSVPFHLSRDLLIRGKLICWGDLDFILVITVHHIIFDRYSIGIMVRELFSIYLEVLGMEPEKLNGLSIHFPDFSQWQRDLPVELMVSWMGYWKRNLEEKIHPLELPTDRPRAQVHTYRAAYQTFTIPENVRDRIKLYGNRAGISDMVTFLGIFKVLLYRYSSHEEIVVGISADSRNQPGMEHVVGPVANLLVIRSYFKVSDCFHKFIEKLSKTVHHAYEYQDMPFDKLVLELNPDKDMSRTALFDVLFQYENDPIRMPEVENLAIDIVDLNLGLGKYDLSLLIQDKGEVLSGVLVYNRDYYNESTVSCFLEHYLLLMQNIMENPYKPILAIDIISDREKQEILGELNATAARYPANETIHGLFGIQVQKTPDRVAIIGPSMRTGQSLSLTYYELNKDSNQLAKSLKKRGVRRDTIVGVMSERSVEVVLGMLAIMKASGAYLPLDPEYPTNRLYYMLKDSQCDLLLAVEKTAHLLEFNKCQILIDDKTLYAEENGCPENINTPHDLIYIIYTSGTTGIPKGSLIEHKNVARLMRNDKYLFDFTYNDIWTMFHSFCFDFSVWEIYGALLYGGKLLIIPKIMAQDTEKFLENLKAECVTILNQTPTAFYNLAEIEFSLKKEELKLRYVIFGGEALNPTKLKEWKNRYPKTRLINMFGITETTVHATYKEITAREIELISSNIGRPIPTTTAYVMTAGFSLQPKAIQGELCIGGEGVGRGYLNKPELIKEKFIPNPYKVSEILYRSGDLAKYLNSGELEYLGRIDEQIKIRGFRIELGEIENRLLKHGDIRESVVIAHEDIKGDRSLCAYFVSSKRLTSPSLRDYLSRDLPDYMIPSYFMQIEKFPLTLQGKIDRDALPDYEKETDDDYISPKNEYEDKLAAIWSEILQINKELIGVMDNFFALGGNSIKVVHLNNKVKEIFKVDIPIAVMFTHFTIRSFAQYLSKEDKFKGVTSKEIDRSVVINITKSNRERRRVTRKTRN